MVNGGRDSQGVSPQGPIETIQIHTQPQTPHPTPTRSELNDGGADPLAALHLKIKMSNVQGSMSMESPPVGSPTVGMDSSPEIPKGFRPLREVKNDSLSNLVQLAERHSNLVQSGKESSFSASDWAKGKRTLGGPANGGSVSPLAGAPSTGLVSFTSRRTDEAPSPLNTIKQEMAEEADESNSASPVLSSPQKAMLKKQFMVKNDSVNNLVALAQAQATQHLMETKKREDQQAAEEVARLKPLHSSDSMLLLSQMAITERKTSSSTLPDSGSLDRLPSGIYKDLMKDEPETLEVFITGVNTLGVKQTQVVNVKHTSLIMSGIGLKSIDLSPLEQIPEVQIKEVSLVANSLETIDLTPLKYCKSLTALMMNGNQLKSVDLRPLKHCKNLERLWMHNNKLETIDLKPLGHCEALRSIYLDSNRIDDRPIDLTALKDCKLLRSLRLTGNKLGGKLDITPLLGCVGLSAFDVNVNVKLMASVASEHMALPSAFRRRAGSIEWVSQEQMREWLEKFGSSSILSMPTTSSSSPATPTSDRRSGSSSESSSGQVTPMDVESAAISAEKAQATNQHSPSLMDVQSQALAEQAASPSGGTQQERYEALLLNFRMSDFYSTRELMSKTGGFNCVGVSDLLYDSASISNYHAVIVQLVKGTDEVNAVKEIRRLTTSVPIFVIGTERMAEVASSCLRHGADRFLSEPLSARDAISIRDLIQQRLRKKHTQEKLAAAAAVAPGSPGVMSPSTASPPSGLDRTSSGTAVGDLKAMGKIPPLLSIRKAPKVPAGGIGGEVRNRMEKPALEKLFARSGGAVGRMQFSPISTLCGLPVCAAPLLFAASVQLLPDMNSERVTADAFIQLWETKLRNMNGEGRLSVIMAAYKPVKKNGESDGNHSTEKPYRNGFMTSNSAIPIEAFYILAEGLVKTLRSRIGEGPDVVEAVASCLLFGLNGSAHTGAPVREKDLQRVNLCSRLLGAESGMYEGPTFQLRPDRFCSIRSIFENARNEKAGGANPSNVNDSSMMDFTRSTSEKLIQLTESEFTDFCAARSLLTRRGAAALFCRHVRPKSPNMTFSDFARFWTATNDLKLDSSLEYFFQVLDYDMNGYISAEDAFHFYTEKEALLQEDGLVLASFWDVWVGILDLVYPKDPKRGFSLFEMTKLSEKNRVYVVQAFMFRDDGNAVIDIRRTMEK
eukprot:CAMPEP_0184708088 /NCGR_PEP_ID=MMETSP0313-20130426/37596_1 /TAXON_ID=2792 /ORGANISM="Porphyridium aerugineum, Strain SAG 1380-2" /LENGTH=1180 /DNA_ID=CAMNT_0027169669 /DNA_START=1022 /DNA_END=4564 /DNA_ORIENTATION=-